MMMYMQEEVARAGETWLKKFTSKMYYRVLTKSNQRLKYKKIQEILDY